MERTVKAGEVFTTFSFNGIDCADMGVYSVTSGGTYTHYMEPIFKDSMAEVPSYDGRYYYGTQFTSQQFQFNMFADNLTLDEYRRLRDWLNPRKVGKLILSEQPYKYYLVKIVSIGALASYPLTTIQTPTESILGGYLSGDTVFVGQFSITFQTIGSCYGYGLDYYQDDLIQKAYEERGKAIYLSDYFYNSGILFKEESPQLNRTIPEGTETKPYPLTWFNPGTMASSPIIKLTMNNNTGKDAYLQFDNATTGATTVIDISNLPAGEITLDPEAETITDKDGISYFGRYTGNPLTVSQNRGVTAVPEFFIDNPSEANYREFNTFYILGSEETPLVVFNPDGFKVSEDLIGQYFCVNGNGGARIMDIDLEGNMLILSTFYKTTYLTPRATFSEDGELISHAGVKCHYVDMFSSVEKLPKEAELGDVAAVPLTTPKGQSIYDMYIYRYGNWEWTSLFTEPSDFKNAYGDFVDKYIMFNAAIVKLDDLTVKSNLGNFDMTVSLLPRYL